MRSPGNGNCTNGPEVELIKRLAMPLAALTLIGAAAPAAAPADSAGANRIHGHVMFLASDELEGRDTGSRGYQIGAQYVASQFAAMGLKPGGANGSWFLEVPFRSATESGTPTGALVRGSGRTRLTAGEDFGVRPSLTEKRRRIEAPLVFAGRGIREPVLGIDDYAGLDVRGKIVVVMAGTPKGLATDIAAHLESDKDEMAASAGAIGLIELPVPGVLTSRPARIKVKGARTDWIEPSGAKPGSLRLEIAVSKKTAGRILEGTGMSVDRITDLAKSGAPLPKLKLSGSLAVEADTEWRDFTSPEVVGVLPGADPRLKTEHVVLMGHLDHLGLKADAKPGEDRVYNGALDNAAGVATMLEAAHKFTTARQRPRRSVMFIANTGEEKGLLGADYFAQHPTVPAASIVGLVDLDMPLLLYDFTDVIAFGAEHSTIASTAAAAGRSMGVSISPDPMPEESLFVRSDHYRFVQRGVPAVFLMTGHANGGKDAWKRFLSTDYHKLSDDLSQPIDWRAGARFAELNYRIARALADGEQRPLWYAGDYFGSRFAPSQPKAPR